MKLSALADRGSRKDFVDLFAITKEHKPLSKIIDLYEKKFESEDITHLLNALGNFDDAERESMPQMLWKISWQSMKQELKHQLRDFVGAK